MMKPEYIQQMKELLDGEFDSYLSEIDQPVRKAFRVNTLKISPDVFFDRFGIEKHPSPFAQNSFYQTAMNPDLRKLLSAAGLIYSQEASAAAAVTIFDPKPGMTILDLCASPGSKTTQIAELMHGEGMLVANEIEPRRAEILVENIERHGIENCLVLNGDPKQLEKVFPSLFDAVLCDAPCSGEGMFRKNSRAADEWTKEGVYSCALRQSHILESAWNMVRPGGILQYSTCTFNLEENEKTILAFLERHPDMEILKPEVEFGRSGYAIGSHTEYCVRIFPMDGGEGHFICKMRKKESEYSFPAIKEIRSEPLTGEIRNGFGEMICEFPHLLVKNNFVYGGKSPFILPGSIRILRHQLLLGEVRKNRTEPSYAAAMAQSGLLKYRVELSDAEALAYLRGETIPYAGMKGFCCVTWNDYAIGLAKCDGSYLKNKLPKNYRIR